MTARPFTAIGSLGRRLLRQSGGSVAPMLAVALIPIVGAVGAAVDFSRATDVRTKLQAAIDAAALAGARDGTPNWMQTALNVFNSQVPSQAVVAAPSFSLNTEKIYSGAVSGVIPTNIVGLLGFSAINVGVSAKASASGHPFCVHALNPTAQPAVSLTGNGSISALQCKVQVNSNASAAVNLSGNATINAAENCFVGSVHKSGGGSVSPAPSAGCLPQLDPFAGYAKPTVGNCAYSNYSASGNTTVTLQPGTYCGGMKFSGQVNVTFAPGLYIIKDGAIEASGGSSFTGNGVTFFLTGKDAGVQLSGGANWHLVAMSSGSLAGFVFYLDPSGGAATTSQLSGSSELYFEGLVYMPKQQLTLTGGSGAYAPSPYTSYIADTLRLTGNGTLVINNDQSKTNVPIPSANLGNQAYLVQ